MFKYNANEGFKRKVQEHINIWTEIPTNLEEPEKISHKKRETGDLHSGSQSMIPRIAILTSPRTYKMQKFSPTESEAVEVNPRNLYFNTESRWSWWALKLRYHNPRKKQYKWRSWDWIYVSIKKIRGKQSDQGRQSLEIKFEQVTREHVKEIIILS
jgi:hypothetical protein